jgi:hypothetical protein
MASTRVFKPSFSGGELSPEMSGRIDDGKFQSGAASLANLIATPIGPAEKRPGFEYVNATKLNGPAKLIPFTYSPTQTMVIELGAGYARFHTMGETLQYSTEGVLPWIESSPGDITYTLTTPAVITWVAHGLATGDPIRFYVTGTPPIPPLPSGLQLGYTYTVVVLTVDTFTFLDQNGNPVGFPGTGSGGTNYPGAGSTSAVLNEGPGQSGSVISSILSGLASEATAGYTITLNAAIDISFYAYMGGGSATFEYYDGTTWNGFYGAAFSESQTLNVTISIPNLDLLQLRIVVSGGAGPSGSVAMSAAINSWSVTLSSPGGPSSAPLACYYYYAAGSIVSYQGVGDPGPLFYNAVVADSGGLTTPGTNAAVWYALPGDLSYEIATPYLAADLFSIHYVQSGDVMTLVHPSYPPMQLERLSATMWTLVGIVFGQALSAPTGVIVGGSPGYQAQIAAITLAATALFTTASNHTLAMGDPIYIKGLTVTIGGVATVLDNFYLVNSVPVDGSGNLIPNELTVMDYDGNVLDSATWSAYAGGATIQYGSKIFNITNTYVVTAVDSDGIQQSAISASASVLNNLDVTGSYNTISWQAVEGANQYYIYRELYGLFGFIGAAQAGTLTFADDNIAVDMSITPPQFDPVFASAENYPGAVSYYQQRRCFGGTDLQPQNFWMTKSGTESDMSYSLPTEDTDRVAIGIAVREMATILHIVPLLQLILLTSSTEMSVSPINTDVITPGTIDPRPQSYIGASNVQPTIVNNSLIYAAARGGHIREMGYQWQIGGYVTGDISLRAAHLFDNLTIVDQAFMKCAWQVVWFVSSNGALLGLTYTPEQQIGAWHHHGTGASDAFQSIACVAEGAEDRLYAVISRTINGAPVNYIERMSTRNFATTPECFYVDAGATFDGTNTTATTMAATPDEAGGALAGTWNLAASAAAFVFPAQTDAGSYMVLTGSDGNVYRFQILSTAPATGANALPTSTIPAGVTFAASAAWSWARPTISGLTWLEGMTVAILADGAVQAQQLVTGGTVTIPRPSTLVTIGLPYSPALETLPLVAQVDGMGQGRVKNINKAWVRVNQSSAIFAGPTPTSLAEYKQRTAEPLGSAPDLTSEEIEIVLPASWQQSGQITVLQTDPLPFTIVGLTLEAVMGG